MPLQGVQVYPTQFAYNKHITTSQSCILMRANAATCCGIDLAGCVYNVMLTCVHATDLLAGVSVAGACLLMCTYVARSRGIDTNRCVYNARCPIRRHCTISGGTLGTVSARIGRAYSRKSTSSAPMFASCTDDHVEWETNGSR